MIDWKSCAAVPNDGVECILYNDEANEIMGPTVYKTDLGGWVQSFGDDEQVFTAGEGGPSHWAVWNGPNH